jgi:hypothetical protein
MNRKGSVVPSLVNVLLSARLAHTLNEISLQSGKGHSKMRGMLYAHLQLQALMSVRWKYRLILAIDANFRMKNKDRSAKDMPALGDGWAHFVPEAPYMKHIRKWGHEEHVRFTPWSIVYFHHSFLSSAIYVIPIFVP